jgi:phosphoglycolate phosphatase
VLYIFDWDGTLCDSLAKIVYCTQQAAVSLGIEKPSEEAVKNIIGLSLPKAIQTVFPNISDADFKRLLARYSDIFIAEQQRTMDFFPGALETLTRLRDDGHTLTIATGKSRRGLDRILKEMALEGFFHGSRCADETESKPAPRMLQELMQEFSTPAEEAIMIGDTEWDMAMAHCIEMPRIAVSYGAHHIDRLRPYDPCYCLDAIEELSACEFPIRAGSNLQR